MGRTINRRGPLPDAVIRFFDEAWQRWDFTGGTPRLLAPSAELAPGAFRRILGIPARQVLAAPLWIDGTDSSLAPETVQLELEVRGLLPRAQGMEGVTTRLLTHESRILAVAAVFPAELAESFPSADVFDVSPFLLALPRNAATLWSEGEDLVVAFTRGDDVVYWETIDRSVGTDELRVWLGLLTLRLRGEAVLEVAPRIVSWVEGIPAARIAPAGCEATEPPDESAPGRPSLQQSRFDWRPVSARLAELQRLRLERIKRVVLAVAACYVVIAAGLALYFGTLRWKANHLAAAAAELRAEVDKFQPIARDWPLIAPTATPAQYPLEILGAVVGGMPAQGVKLILFKIEDGAVTVNGEADTFQMATDYFNALAASGALSGFNLQSDTPVMKANNSASFSIHGTIPTS